MGCLQTKPKLRPQTVVVHSCDYHSDGMNGVVKILKSPSPSARYASTDVISEIAESSDQPRFVRRKPNATPSKTPPSSPHITLPSTPDEEKSTLHVLDAEDLEPANYIPTSEEVAETKTALSEINSHVSVSEVTFNPAGSIGASQTQSSKQSILSSQDTLTVEELDSDMDDFSQMRLVCGRLRPVSESHLMRNRTFVVKHGFRLPQRPNSERVRPLPEVAWP